MFSRERDIPHHNHVYQMNIPNLSYISKISPLHSLNFVIVLHSHKPTRYPHINYLAFTSHLAILHMYLTNA